MKMMKFNSVIMLMILCGGLQLSCCENLVCQFRNGYYLLVGTLYECRVTSLDNSFDNMTIDGYVGTHNVHKNDKDVKGIWINDGNTKYIPDGLGSVFNLLGLAIWTSQLVEIKSNNFLGMQNLEYLSLYGNKLTSVPSDAFSSLPKLIYIDFLIMIDFDQLNTTDNMPISNKCNSFTINCNFLNTNGTYTCETRNLFINQKEMELSKIYGTHLKSKSNQNVTELIIVKSSMFYLSNDIFTKFPALQTLRIQNAQLNEFKKGDFISASELRFLVVNGNNIKPLGDDVFHGTEELTKINMNSNQIEEISAGTFRGLKQLIFLSLKDNLITEIPVGSFKETVLLEILILTGNKIRFLDGKMLQFNRRLMTLAVDQNELREVGEEILDHSVELLDVNLEGNDCIDERTTINDDDTDGRTINDLIFVIRNCCKNPGKGLNLYNCGRSGSED